jgi:hypothetical protein
MITLAVFLAAVGGFATVAIKDRKPRDTLDTPLIPTTPLLFISALVGLLALVHLVNLFGIHTGR